MADREDDAPRPALEIKDGGAPVGKQAKWIRENLLDTTSHNFLGSGLTFGEYMTTMDVLRYDRWYATQTRDERNRRMQYLIQLCAEQQRLVDESIQATGLSQSLIEAVIEGDWSAVHMWIQHLTFDDERGSFRSLQAKRFARFREIAQEAYDTRPTVFCPSCFRPAPERCIGSPPNDPHRCPWCDVVHDGVTVQDVDRSPVRPVEDPHA